MKGAAKCDNRCGPNSRVRRMVAKAATFFPFFLHVMFLKLLVVTGDGRNSAKLELPTKPFRIADRPS